MATRSSFNKNNSAVKRIMQEAREIQNDPSTEYSAAPLEDNLFEWHCTLRGAPETEFEGGLYHFRIVLPAEYPFRPPSLMMLTPSGRFETNSKLCISFTNYHEELWQPAWGVRTAIIGLQGFFPLKGQAAMGVGSMEAPGSERRRLAKLSREWVCPQCKVPNHECLPDPPQGGSRDRAPSTSSVGVGGALSSMANSVGVLPTATSATDSETVKPGGTADSVASGERGSARERESIVLAPSSNTDAQAPRPVGSSENPSQRTRSGGGEGLTVERVRSVEQQQSSAVEIVSAGVAAASASSSSRPPILLDAAISVLLVLVAALLCRKVL